MMVRRIFYYVDGRLYEWVMSVPIFLLAVMLFIWPQITNAPAFRLFAWLFSPDFIALSFMACGLACIAALIVNGASPKIGPRIRSWTALARSVLWFQFGLSTLQAGLVQGYPFTVLPFWFTFAFAEIWVAYRAGLDVRASS